MMENSFHICSQYTTYAVGLLVYFREKVCYT